MTFSNLKNRTTRGLFSTLMIAALAMAGCSVDSKKGKSAAPGDAHDFAMDGGTNFRVDTVSVASTAVVSWQSNGQYPAKKLFNFVACLKDAAGNAIAPDIAFKVSDDAGGENALTTFKNGCLVWAESFELNGLESESLFLLKRTITANGPYVGKVYVQGGLNPWADNAASFVDFRTTQVPERIKVIDAGAVGMRGFKVKSAGTGPKIFVDSINFQFLGLNYDSYEINRFLGLTVAQNYRVRMKPQVIRQTLTNEIDLKTINKGQMKVTVALLKDATGNKLDPKNYITSTEFVGNIILGTLTADVTLKFAPGALPDMLSRSQVVVTLTPIDDLADFGESTYQGPSSPGLLAAITVVPSDDNARSLALSAAAASLAANKVHEAMSPMQLFAKLSSLKPFVGPATVKVGGFFGIGTQTLPTGAALEKLLAGELSSGETRDLAKAFCISMYGSHALRDYCPNAEAVLFMAQRDIVESVVKNPTRIGETTKETLSMRTRVDYVNSDGSSDSLKWGWSAGLAGELSAGGGTDWSLPIDKVEGSSWTQKVGAGGSLKGTLGARVGYGQDWYQTKTRSRATSVATESARTIDVIGNSFEISAKVRRCVIIGPSPTSSMIDRFKWDKTQFYYCSKNVRSVKKTETFYLLNEKVGDDTTGFSDSGRPGGSAWRMFMRGPKTYLLFKEMIEALRSNDLVLEKIPESSALQQTMKQFPEFYMMQEYPGMFTP